MHLFENFMQSFPFSLDQYTSNTIKVNNAGVLGDMYLTDDIVEPDDASQ